jgi:agmatinase
VDFEFWQIEGMVNFMTEARALIISPRVFIESQQAGHVTLFERESSQRVRVSKGLYSVLTKFQEPALVSEVSAEHNLPMSARRAIDQLIEKRFLVDAEAPFQARRKPLTRNPYTLFNCPRCSGGQCETDVAVVGIPFDLGSQVAAGTRNAPLKLRLRSNEFDYRVNFNTGQPMGWFDVDAERRILEGVRICDRGDLWFAYGEPPEVISERFEEFCRQGHRNSFPVFLGGDHSFSYPVIKALQTDEPLTVIWFDAHSDMGHFIPPSSHNHFSVARRVLNLPNVVKMVNVGYRGYGMKDEVNSVDPRRVVVTPKKLRQCGAQAILDLIPADSACYLSIDMDALDPSHAPAVSSPRPGGLSAEELWQAIARVGKHRRCVGMDLMEFNADLEGADRTGTVAAHLLLAGLGGIMANRERNQVNESEAVLAI